MTRAHEEPELLELIHRYVTVDQRYLRLGVGLTGLTGRERSRAVQDLAAAAARITDAELTVLLDQGGWRERKTAAWLVAASDRRWFRPRLGELLLASDGPYAGAAYCVALASFGTEADAQILCDYLDLYLRRPDLDYDQGVAMGALRHVDAELGGGHPARYLAPGGPWELWHAAVPSRPDESAIQRTTAALVGFARECVRAAGAAAPPRRRWPVLRQRRRSQ
ncbi:DUF6000 family protein [Streptacidiphilus rugosus]|uniref:DUF6000 family protein n=1 Tax=Streptacidiphilus rugosus TaxID=405783 RepID=UPI0006917D3C|nr:DUF6000 family protein [Streptacidiphilus rugosus]